MGCLTVKASRISIFSQQALLALPSRLVLQSLHALKHLLASPTLLQDSHPQRETHMYGERGRQGGASRAERAGEVGGVAEQSHDHQHNELRAAHTGQSPAVV